MRSRLAHCRYFVYNVVVQLNIEYTSRSQASRAKTTRLGPFVFLGGCMVGRYKKSGRSAVNTPALKHNTHACGRWSRANS